MNVIVGLGNPGRRYDGTRHNVGFETIDLLAQRNDIKVNKLKFKALYGEGIIGGKKVLLVKPQTFMNLSGQSLLELVQFYKLEMNQITVIYDDIDIAVGTIRIREKGSAGTHNGMRSIIYQLQKDNFPRIRIGVGKPEQMDLAAFVLSPFRGEEQEGIRRALENAALAAETLVEKNIQEAMNKYNG